MHQGTIYKNQQGRFTLDDGYYWTCGDAMELYYDDEWLNGRVEADSRGEYYFTDDDCIIYLQNGILARAE